MEKKWIRFLIFITALVMGMVIGMMVSPSHAAPTDAPGSKLCGERDWLANSLSKNNSEIATFMALATNGQMFEVFLAPDGDFTAVLTQPSGRTCVVIWGVGWQRTPPQPLGEPT